MVMVLAPSRAPLEVGDRGPGHADVVDAAVLVEAVVLGREDGRLHDLGDVLRSSTTARFSSPNSPISSPSAL